MDVYMFDLFSLSNTLRRHTAPCIHVHADNTLAHMQVYIDMYLAPGQALTKLESAAECRGRPLRSGRGRGGRGGRRTAPGRRRKRPRAPWQHGQCFGPRAALASGRPAAVHHLRGQRRGGAEQQQQQRHQGACVRVLLCMYMCMCVCACVASGGGKCVEEVVAIYG